MQCRRLFEKIDELNDTYLDIFEDVCNIESPTDFKAGVDAVGQYFISLAKLRGWQIEVLELEKAGNAVCITLNPEASLGSVTFSGHIDTVHPVGLFGTPAVRRDRENIYGPGVLDCKGGVVASFMAMDALDKCGFRSRPVQLIIQSDEETGSKTSEKQTVKFMCEKAKNSIAFLNTEGAEGATAVLMRKGILRYRFNVSGKAAHSSRCPYGANAVAEAAHKILRLEKFKDIEGLTCNCGVIKGGTAANTVAAECSFLADLRFSNKEQYEEAVKLVNTVAKTSEIEGCSCILEEVSYRPAMQLTEKNIELLEKINGIYKENALPQLSYRLATGGSDAAYITEAGIPCIDNVGVEGEFLHTEKEYARLASLAESAKRLAAVAYCI